jgi:hypothetical protein
MNHILKPLQNLVAGLCWQQGRQRKTVDALLLLLLLLRQRGRWQN